MSWAMNFGQNDVTPYTFFPLSDPLAQRVRDVICMQRKAMQCNVMESSAVQRSGTEWNVM